MIWEAGWLAPGHSSPVRGGEFLPPASDPARLRLRLGPKQALVRSQPSQIMCRIVPSEWPERDRLAKRTKGCLFGERIGKISSSRFLIPWDGLSRLCMRPWRAYRRGGCQKSLLIRSDSIGDWASPFIHHNIKYRIYIVRIIYAAGREVYVRVWACVGGGRALDKLAVGVVACECERGRIQMTSKFGRCGGPFRA